MSLRRSERPGRANSRLMQRTYSLARSSAASDFLGYHFSPAGLTVAAKTIVNFIEKASRLYEQKRNAGSAVTALEIYARRWFRWASGGLVMFPLALQPAHDLIAAAC
jgi:hypothetical protein